MQVQGSLTARIAGLALIALLAAVGNASAQSTLSPEIAATIERAVQSSRSLAAREMALAGSLGNAALVQTSARKAKARADTTLTSAVISLIAQNMGQADAIVQAATAAAPDSRSSILAGVYAAYPSLGGAPATPGAAPLQFASLAVVPVPPPAPVGRAPVPGAPPTEVAPPSVVVQEEVFDPLEPINRGIFAFNATLDMLIFRPIASLYGYVMPDLAKRSISRFFDNLKSPIILANDLLQLTFDDAAVTTGRFLINSTIGVGGLFEVAKDFGLEPHTADFGQTLHSYGVGQGFYVMIPILGPSTLRDGLGRAVDSFFQPVNYLLGTEEQLILRGVEGLVEREALLDVLDDLRENSIDFYGAVRGAYYQDRATELRKGREATTETIDVLFEGLE